MTIKEKPLIDAVEKLGPLPGFLFANPVVGGFVAAVMCAVFGGVFMFFQVAGRGEADMLALQSVEDKDGYLISEEPRLENFARRDR